MTTSIDSALMTTPIDPQAAKALVPTDEQRAILEAVSTTKDNILISALAGAAKTTTLEMLAFQCREPTIAIAFNKRIAQEMNNRLPDHVTSSTINSLGHRVWAASCGRRLIVKSDKTRQILRELLDQLRGYDRDQAWNIFPDIVRAAALCKSAGYVPSTVQHGRPLTRSVEFLEDFLDSQLPPLGRRLLDETLVLSIKQAFSGTIDFDDQIFMPVIFGGPFPTGKIILVDEAQDLSPLNHAFLERLAPSRLIAVGDRFQSIYAFRGADSDAMDRLQGTFSMREMTLSTSFRCPSAIVAHQSRAPHMRAWRKGGEVRVVESMSLRDIPAGAAIICRNNAPLFGLGLALLAAKRPVKILGADIGKELIRTLRRFKGADSLEALLAAIDSWEAVRSKKASVADKAECLRIFAREGGSHSGAIAYAELLFSSEGEIQLMTGHKAKGLEFDHVIHFKPELIPSQYCSSPQELTQEMNLRYVIETRSRDKLTILTRVHR